MARARLYPPSVDPGFPSLPATPSGWTRRTFGEVVDVIERPIRLEPTSKYQLVTAKRSRGGIVARSELLGQEVLTKTQFQVRAGDFLISRRQIIHGACGVVSVALDGAVVSNEYSSLRTRPNLSMEFLRQYSHTPYFQRTCFHSSHGVDVEKMVFKIDEWLRWPVDVPPLEEQQKIAAILSSVDDVIEKTKAVVARLQVVKMAMMQELLTRGLPGRHTHSKMTEIGELPEHWRVSRAGDVCVAITKGATPKEQTRDHGEVPFLKVYNLGTDGQVDFAYQPTFIPARVHVGELKRSRVGTGDVLMNIVGPPLGKVAIVPESLREANINQAIALFRVGNDLDRRFLHACLSSEHLFGWALARAKRTSTQLNLTLEICRDYPIPLPPREEQKAIADALEAVEQSRQCNLAVLEAMKGVKTALADALLTGEVRVNVDQEVAA